MPRRYLLSELAASIMRDLASKRGGVALEDRRIAPPVASFRPLPFDCKLATGMGANADETHLLCYIPPDCPCVIAADGAITPSLKLLPGQTLDMETNWLDCGEIEPGQFVVLGAIVSASAFANYGHGAPFYETCEYCVTISSTPAFSEPAGYASAYCLIPPRVLAHFGTTGLRQTFHGIYLTTASIPDDYLSGNAWTSSNLRTDSIDENEGGYPNCTRIHGFRVPTIISNPYAAGGTAPGSDSDLLILVRVVTGTTAELKYMPVASVVASSGGGGTSDFPYPDVPCPADGYGDAAIWDACAGGWRSLRGMASIFGYALKDEFWPQGGDETNCYGEAIGNSQKGKVIDLDNLALWGNWMVQGSLLVGESSMPADLYVSRDATIEEDLKVFGDTALGNTSTGNLNVGGSLEIGGDVYAPEVVTIGGVQKTILVKQ